MKRLIRSLLWKCLKRDYLVLNPDWAVANRTDEYALLGDAAVGSRRFLPVSYNYHTPKDWRLEYRLRGDVAGTLRYKLRVPGKGIFCDMTQRVQLPLTWTVALDADGLAGNEERLPIVPGKTIPRDTPWLVGEFEFHSNTGETFARGTGHRVQLAAGDADENYFKGMGYENYEERAGIFPQQILDTIRRHRPMRGKFLDIGCATGLLVKEALASGLDAEGIDFSPWAVEKANALTASRCRVLNFDKATLSDFPSRYDIITLHSVIEHLSDPACALGLLFQLIRPDGVVYLQTLNADSLMHRLLQKDWSGYTDYTHKCPWITADWLAETSRRTGFQILSLKRYGVWNDNVHDEVWKSFSSVIQLLPAGVVLEEQFGDFVELVLQRSAD